MKDYNFKDWLKAAGIRAIKTVAQTALGMLTIGATIQEVNWINVASVALVAGIYSMLTSVAGLPELDAEKEVNNEVGYDVLLEEFDVDESEGTKNE